MDSATANDQNIQTELKWLFLMQMMDCPALFTGGLCFHHVTTARAWCWGLAWSRSVMPLQSTANRNSSRREGSFLHTSRMPTSEVVQWVTQAFHARSSTNSVQNLKKSTRPRTHSLSPHPHRLAQGSHFATLGLDLQTHKARCNQPKSINPTDPKGDPGVSRPPWLTLNLRNVHARQSLFVARHPN